MAACDLRFELDDPDKVYEGGETISGQVVVTVDKPTNCKELEVSCWWTTHGRGNVDSGRVDSTAVFSGSWEAGQEYRYPFQLKTATWPPTYYGNYLNVSHQARAQAKVAWAIDPKAVIEFPVRASASPADLAPERATAKNNYRWIGITLAIIFLAAVGWMVIFLLPVMLIVGGLVWFFTSYLPKSLTGNVECSITPERLQPGETLQGRLAFTPKRKVRINGVQYTVNCEEVCVSGSGSNRKTHRHSLLSYTGTLLEAGHLLPGQQQAFEFDYQIPLNAAPSLDLTDNDLNWSVELRIDIPRWPDWKKVLKFIVNPSREPPRIDQPAAEPKTWLGQVVEQLHATEDAPEQQQLVLQAIREHVFDVSLQLEERLGQSPTSSVQEPGVWFAMLHAEEDVGFWVFFPEGVPHPQERTAWRGQFQIVGYDEEILARVVG